MSRQILSSEWKEIETLKPVKKIQPQANITPISRLEEEGAPGFRVLGVYNNMRRAQKTKKSAKT